VDVYEPADGWSRIHLLREHGSAPLEELSARFPHLRSRTYEPARLAHDAVLDDLLAGVDLVIVHEWNAPEVVARIGAHRAGRRYRLLFHDTHHRAVTDPAALAALDLRHYDGVLAFGSVIRDVYLRRGWAARAWTWHEAADTRIFHPRPPPEGEPMGDLVWVGNWGDGERDAELHALLLEPIAALGLRAELYGVRYPAAAVTAIERAGAVYRGWVPNHRVPEVFARFRVTVHVPRRPYAAALPGIPTIRPFEAMACGIPLVTGPWDDTEQLFTVGRDYLLARSGAEMRRHLRAILGDRDLARELAAHARQTILARHTCAARVDELLDICEWLIGSPARASGPRATGAAAPE
jgi:spore maturation protein CgeB